MQWFRLHCEFATDPKVQMLSEKDQRRYVMLLCLRCCNGDVTLQDDAVAFQLRISNDEWLETKALLMSKNLIDDDNKPVNWDKRQYTSDSSSERVKKHREKKKRYSNVTVTPPDTDTDTDTDTELNKPKEKKNEKTGFKFNDYCEQNGGSLEPFRLPGNFGAIAVESGASEGRIEEQFELFYDYYTVGKGKSTRSNAWGRRWSTWINKPWSSKGDNKAGGKSGDGFAEAVNSVLSRRS